MPAVPVGNGIRIMALSAGKEHYMGIIGGIMVPHPPLIIPEVGRGSEKTVEETIRAYERAADLVASLRPETIVISSPHSVMYSDYIHISPGDSAGGDMRQFGAPEAGMLISYDVSLRQRIEELCDEFSFPAGTEGERNPELDHGTMVPLYYILKKYKDFKLIRTGISGLSLPDHYHFGMLVARAAEDLNRRVLFVGSGDLSHKLKESGPYGFDKRGPEYDEKIMKVMGDGDFSELLRFPPDLLDKAAECGHRSFCIMAGAFDRKSLEIEKLSHEDVTGVGYGICTYKCTGEDKDRAFLDKWYEDRLMKLDKERSAEDIYVTLARNTIENYIKDGTIIRAGGDLPDEMLKRKAGTFVSLHKDGDLRGCIGTISPVRDCIANEIISNAISAATGDPRFSPVRPDELPFLEYSVDVLSETEKISSPDELDVKRYGVIVTKGNRRGLLLPNLEGVDTVSGQIDIAKRKAGIAPDEEDVMLERFEVVRHCPKEDR